MNPELMSILKEQYDRSLPFVAYSKPGSSTASLLRQADNNIHRVTDFTGQGFIMAGYRKGDDPILISGIPKLFPLDDLTKINQPQAPFIQEESGLTYKASVAKAVKEINTGSLKKVVLSRKQTILVTAGPLELFERLITNYPMAFTYIWYHPKVGLWLGATPETLLSIKGLRFQTMALAGTQSYLGSDQVSWGAKEQDEQQLVVETIKTQLEQLNIAQITIKERETIRAGELLHLKTEITGLLNKPQQLGDVIHALHPTPAVCGLPRDLAKMFIQKNENYDRQFYTGFLGELNLPSKDRRGRNTRNIENQSYSQFIQNSDLYVNLRCMCYKKHEVTLYIGAGITNGSDPHQEWLETLAKMQTMAKVLS